jgi:hypothetical protein
VWFLKGKVSLSNETYRSLEGGAPTFQQPQLSITFINRTKDGRKKVEVDSDDTSIGEGVIAAWFTSVYETPDPEL